MRLLTIELGGRQVLGVESGDSVAHFPNLFESNAEPWQAFLADPRSYLERFRREMSRGAGVVARKDQIRILAPIPRPGKIIAVGRNYRDHALEGGDPPPSEPLLFAKLTSSISADGDDIKWDPAFATSVDFEAELAVVIGQRARRVAVDDALSHVLGYTCANDISARDIQFRDVQWTRGKSLDTFCPLGPAIVTADEVPDPQRLRISCELNGTVVQRDSTANMLFSVAQVISFCSEAFTLEPGDLILTGTPSGVGYFRSPQILLKDGDIVAVEISGIGRLSNSCRFEPASGTSVEATDRS